jgi:hypothetical protein
MTCASSAPGSPEPTPRWRPAPIWNACTFEAFKRWLSTHPTPSAGKPLNRVSIKNALINLHCFLTSQNETCSQAVGCRRNANWDDRQYVCITLAPMSQPLVVSILGHTPQIHPEAWVAPNASLIGAVRLSGAVSVWYGATLRAEFEPIDVGFGTNIQDGATGIVKLFENDCGAVDVSLFGGQIYWLTRSFMPLRWQ